MSFRSYLPLDAVRPALEALRLGALLRFALAVLRPALAALRAEGLGVVRVTVRLALALLGLGLL